MPAAVSAEKLAALLVAGRGSVRRGDTRVEASLRGREAVQPLGGVPMHWMTEWASPYPIFVTHAEGIHVVDVDGSPYVDLCLGDTGAMTGQRAPAVEASPGGRRGDHVHAPHRGRRMGGEELSRRFGLPCWQFALTATDTNRFVIRLARHLTGRPRPVSTTSATTAHGRRDLRGPRGRRGLDPGRQHGDRLSTRPTTTGGRDQRRGRARGRSSPGDVAVVLIEPALTNRHRAARAGLPRRPARPPPAEPGRCSSSTRPTRSAPARAATRAHALEPDFLTHRASPLASGIPAGRVRLHRRAGRAPIGPITGATHADVGGIGGTLAGNALSLAAMRATLEHVLTDDGLRADDRARGAVRDRRAGR